MLLLLALSLLSAAPALAWRYSRTHSNSGGSGGCPAEAVPFSSYIGPSPGFNPDMRVDPRIVQQAENIASHFGRRILISSGCRPPNRNAAAQGADNSAHLRGNALDIPNSNPYGLAQQLLSAGIVTGGYYRTCNRLHLHIDLEHQGFANECKGSYKRKGGNGRHRYRAYGHGRRRWRS
jgi:Peptidase M15